MDAAIKKSFGGSASGGIAVTYNFSDSEIAFGLAQEDSVEEFEELARSFTRRRIRFVDPCWSLDKMIAHLAGCAGVLTPFDSDL
jgi:hypothetical protein